MLLIRTAFLLLAFVANRHWLWNAGPLPSYGEWHVWAGTAHRFDFGPYVCLSWDDEGLWWVACWYDRQDEADEFERDVWAVEGRLSRER